jgi:hypothetical protein
MPGELLGAPRSVPMIDPYGYDADAARYIEAVERADGRRLELQVRSALATFIADLKKRGWYTAIKQSCILCGARTLAGALVPLKGDAPTNNNFVSGDYNRKSGLVGDRSTKYLRVTGVPVGVASSQSVRVTHAGTVGVFGEPPRIVAGCGTTTESGATHLARTVNFANVSFAGRSRTNQIFIGATPSLAAQGSLWATVRSDDTILTTYLFGRTTRAARPASGTPISTVHVFASRQISNNAAINPVDMRCAFFHFGEAPAGDSEVALHALNATVDTLLSALSLAIP